MNQIDAAKTKYMPILETTLKAYFTEAKTAHSAFNSAMSAYHFETGGKRLRGIIPSAVFEALGRNGAEILPFGAAVEMIHNATLVHDDLQDGDEVRRGRATVWKKYSEAQAINCGDAMFQYAFELIMKLSMGPETALRLMKRATTSTLRVIEGQAQEFVMKEEISPNVGRYTEIIRGKTSGLFALPVAGALDAAGVDEDTCAAFDQAAMDMGMLFQIQDDLLDIYGSKGRDRKATDIAEGKVSVMVAHVYEVASAEDKTEMSSVLRSSRKSTTDAEIARVISIFEKYKAKDKAVQVIREIQSNLKDSSQLEKLPTVHAMLVDLCETFLEPLHGIV